MATAPTQVTWQEMQRMLTCLLEATEVIRVANDRRQQTVDLLDEAIHVSSALWARQEALVAAHTRLATRRAELDRLRADVAGAQRKVEEKREDVARRRGELREARDSLRAASTRLLETDQLLTQEGSKQQLAVRRRLATRRRRMLVQLAGIIPLSPSSPSPSASSSPSPSPSSSSTSSLPSSTSSSAVSIRPPSSSSSSSSSSRPSPASSPTPPTALRHVASADSSWGGGWGFWGRGGGGAVGAGGKAGQGVGGGEGGGEGENGRRISGDGLREGGGEGGGSEGGSGGPGAEKNSGAREGESENDRGAREGESENDRGAREGESENDRGESKKQGKMFSESMLSDSGKGKEREGVVQPSTAMGGSDGGGRRAKGKVGGGGGGGVTIRNGEKLVENSRARTSGKDGGVDVTIMGLPLITAPRLQALFSAVGTGMDESLRQRHDAALGLTAQLVYFCAHYLHLPLRYPILLAASRCLMVDRHPPARVEAQLMQLQVGGGEVVGRGGAGKGGGGGSVGPQQQQQQRQRQQLLYRSASDMNLLTGNGNGSSGPKRGHRAGGSRPSSPERDGARPASNAAVMRDRRGMKGAGGPDDAGWEAVGRGTSQSSSSSSTNGSSSSSSGGGGGGGGGWGGNAMIVGAGTWDVGAAVGAVGGGMVGAGGVEVKLALYIGQAHDAGRCACAMVLLGNDIEQVLAAVGLHWKGSRHLLLYNLFRFFAAVDAGHCRLA
ncbi:hypothetical protein CLOP_g3703 [Closterium sp. NIES-67]|nr:hypothetical protein CLOP_g3703 [Closterium sp. NIES-67]